MWTAVIGYTAGGLVALLQVPQLWSVWRTKDAQGVSKASVALHTVNGTLWIVYGTLLEQPPIVLANAFYLASNVGLLYACWKFGGATTLPTTEA